MVTLIISYVFKEIGIDKKIIPIKNVLILNSGSFKAFDVQLNQKEFQKIPNFKKF